MPTTNRISTSMTAPIRITSRCQRLRMLASGFPTTTKSKLCCRFERKAAASGRPVRRRIGRAFLQIVRAPAWLLARFFPMTSRSNGVRMMIVRSRRSTVIVSPGLA